MNSQRLSGYALLLLMISCMGMTLASKKHFIDKIGPDGLVIDKPGEYIVCKDLTYAGTFVAISIVSSGVTLDFGGHTLSLTQDGAYGVVVPSLADHVTLKNGIISGPLSSTLTPTAGANIYFTQAQHGVIDNMVLKNGYFGVLLDNSSDIRVTKTFINEFFGSDVNIRANNNGVTLQDCVFQNTTDNQMVIGGINVGLYNGAPTGPITYPETTNYDIALLNCQHINADILIGASTTRGVRIDNVTSVLNDNTYPFTMFEIGIQNDVTSDVIVTNSSFSNMANQPNQNTAGVGIFSARNVLFDNVAIECNNNQEGDNGGEPITISSAGLILGENDVINFLAGASSVNNMIIRNCVISGGSLDAIKLVAPDNDPNTNIVIEDCAIADATANLINAQSVAGSAFRRNNLVNAVTGINLQPFADGNIIRDNAFSILKTGVILGDGTTNNGIVNNTFTDVDVHFTGSGVNGNFDAQNLP